MNQGGLLFLRQAKGIQLNLSQDNARFSKSFIGVNRTGTQAAKSITRQCHSCQEPFWQFEILSAEKNEVGDFWNLVARIKYGDHDKTLPLPPIEIKFADKTPVITIDKVTFPGFGTFDARVLIRQGKYAGTWAHSGGKGGHLFGTIEPMDPEEVKEKTKQVKDKQ